jgi:hypothetical protein
VTAYGTEALMAKAADTGDAGYQLVNATGTILSWTAPADGQLHRITLTALLGVTSTETGGAIGLTFTDPGGTTHTNSTQFAGGAGAGVTTALADRLVAPGSTVSLNQFSALTGGAAVLWAQIWAA